MNISGFRSTFPAGGINLRKKPKIGCVKLFNNGAIGVFGLIQLSTACINTAYRKIVILMLTTPISAIASIVSQTLAPTINNGKPFSHKVSMLSNS